MPEWKAKLIRALGGVVPERRTVVVQADIERTEELRVDRLGPDEDDLDKDEREPFVPDDPWRPSTTLGPIRRH